MLWFRVHFNVISVFALPLYVNMFDNAVYEVDGPIKEASHYYHEVKSYLQVLDFYWRETFFLDAFVSLVVKFFCRIM